MIYKNININKNQIAYFKSIDSTNSYLKKIITTNPNSTLKLCIADTQTQGKGTRGKIWISPESGNIYMTYKILIPNNKTTPPLPIISAISIAEALEYLYPDLKIQLKWPNDLMINNKKIGGILIEIINNTALIGIGININPVKNPELINQPITDIKTELDKINILNLDIKSNIKLDIKSNIKLDIKLDIKKEKIICEIIKNINKYLDKYLNQTNSNNQEISLINKTITKWQKRDLYYKKEIKIDINNKTITAEHLGISNCGGLILKIQPKEKTKNKEKIIKIHNGSIKDIL